MGFNTVRLARQSASFRSSSASRPPSVRRSTSRPSCRGRARRRAVCARRPRSPSSCRGHGRPRRPRPSGSVVCRIAHAGETSGRSRTRSVALTSARSQPAACPGHVEPATRSGRPRGRLPIAHSAPPLHSAFSKTPSCSRCSATPDLSPASSPRILARSRIAMRADPTPRASAGAFTLIPSHAWDDPPCRSSGAVRLGRHDRSAEY